MLPLCYTAPPKLLFLCPSLQWLAQALAANCICKIPCINALDGFDFSTVHELSSREQISTEPIKYRLSRDSNLGPLGEKRKCYLCAMRPPFFQHYASLMISLCFIWLIFGVFHSNTFLVTSKPSKNPNSLRSLKFKSRQKKFRARMKPEPKLEFEMVAKDSCRLWCWLELLKGFEHDLVGPCYRLQATSFTQVCAYQV